MKFEVADGVADGERLSQPAAPEVDESAPGPHNNWLQAVKYEDVTTLPSDFDASREPTDDAPNGWLTDGRPFSPYGVRRKSGRPRRRPVPSQKGRDDHIVQPGTSQHSRFAPGKKPDNAEVRQREEELTPGESKFGAMTVEWVLIVITRFLAEKVIGDPTLKPDPKMLSEAAEKVSDASRYYGIDTSPKAAATFAAGFAVVALFLPYLLAGIDKFIEKRSNT
jgi:hypothetical protein